MDSAKPGAPARERASRIWAGPQRPVQPGLCGPEQRVGKRDRHQDVGVENDTERHPSAPAFRAAFNSSV